MHVHVLRHFQRYVEKKSQEIGVTTSAYNKRTHSLESMSNLWHQHLPPSNTYRCKHTDGLQSFKCGS